MQQLRFQMLQKGNAFKKHIAKGNRTAYFAPSYVPLKKTIFPFWCMACPQLFNRNTNNKPLQGCGENQMSLVFPGLVVWVLITATNNYCVPPVIMF